MLSPIIAAVIFSFVSPLAVPLAARADGDDASGAAVARLSLITGTVAVQRGDSEEPTSAALNAPVLGADYITTGPDSRAEVEFDGSTMVRLGENVQARFSHIDPQDRQLQLAAGTIDFRLFHGPNGNTAIDTPSVSIVPTESGAYRVNVTPDGTTELTVRSGRANVVSPQGTQVATPGSTIIASGAASNPNVQSTTALVLDSFDTFNDERDRTYQRNVASTAPYVDNSIDGAGDLSANGTWVNDNVYGHAWVPANVAPDWAPYSDGRWVWEDGYGWTWVAAEPWGWAPYHYGRWFYQASFNRWAWTPPPLYSRPSWSPALVGFIGFNIGAVRVGLGIGSNIGWVPLAPNEPFRPWWGRGTNSMSIGNVTMNNNYRNMMFRNAVTGVSTANFQAGRFNQRVAFSGAELRNGQAFHGALPVAPTQANLRYADRALPASFATRNAFAQRSFAGHATMTTRTPFAQQQATFARSAGVAVPAAAQRGSESFNRSAASGSGSAWDRFGSRVPASSARLNAATFPNTDRAINSERGTQATTGANTSLGNGAWSRFGSNRGTGYAPRSGQTGPASDQRTLQSSRNGYVRPQAQSQSGNGYFRPQAQSQSGNGYVRPQAQSRDTSTRTQSASPSYRRQGESAPSRGSSGTGGGGRSSSQPNAHSTGHAHYGR